MQHKYLLLYLLFPKLIYNILMKSFIVEKKYDGKKINQVLLNTFNGLSLNNIYKALRKKDIKVNNIRISENTIVHFGDEVKVFISDEFLFKKVENIY